VKENPKDELALAKGMMKANFSKLLLFWTVRLVLMVNDLIQPFLVVHFIDWLQSTEPDTFETISWALFMALLVPVSRLLHKVIWEHFCFSMIECGHMTHTSLKAMLFAKNLRMSNATNKDFDQGQISSIIMGDTGRIWTIIFEVTNYIEAPLNLIVAIYFVFQNIGWYGLIVVLKTLAQFQAGYLREKTESLVNKERGEKHQERMKHINESFQNIKGIKLYGWENKFLDKIEKIHEEEVSLQDKCMLRNKLHDMLNGSLDIFMPLLIYGLYVANGNPLDLSKMFITNMMLGKIQGGMHHIRHLMNSWFDLEEALERLNKFYFSPNIQKDLVNKKESATCDSEYSIKVEGNFSWGVNGLDKDEKRK